MIGADQEAQLGLFARLLVHEAEEVAPSTPRRPQSLDERFEAWLAQNGEAYSALRQAALDAYRAGARRLSIAKLAEELRADFSVATTGSPWRVNNSFRAPLARRIMEDEPSLLGVFELRHRRSGGGA